jgi:rRNA maturation endonuclease Nob1
MNIVAEVRDSIVPSSDGETTYECIDCLAEFDEHRHLCPKCGGERFGTA